MPPLTLAYHNGRPIGQYGRGKPLGQMVVRMQHPTLVSCPQQVDVFLDSDVNLLYDFSIISFVVSFAIWDVPICRKQVH